MILLQGPDKTYSPKISLGLIEALEASYGSLYRVAEGLLDGSWLVSKTVGLLKILYRHAGCETEEDALDAFLLQQPCTELLMRALVEILSPIERMGAHLPGEALTAREERST